MFLIAMLAYFAERHSVAPFVTGVISWDGLGQSELPFLGKLSQEDARHAALSYFHLFRELFRKKQLPSGADSQLQECRADREGARYVWSFNWSAAKSKFPQRWTQFSGTALALPTYCEPDNAFQSVLLASRYLIPSAAGFGHPGHIRMEDKNLYVTSTA
jgi:hypothetical protein